MLTRSVFNRLKAIIEERLGENSLDAVDEINFPSHVITPLIEDVSPLTCIVILIDSFNNKLDCILKFLLQKSRFSIFLLNILIEVIDLLNEMFLLKLGLEDGIINSHCFSLHFTLAFYDVRCLHPIFEGSFNYIKLAFLDMSNCYLKQALFVSIKFNVFSPFLKSSGQVYPMKASERV